MSKLLQCEWCELPQYNSNITRHHERCFYKNELGMRKSEFLYLKSKLKLDIKSERRDELTMLELKSFLTDLYNKVLNLYKRVIVEDGRDPIDKIEELNVGLSTKKITFANGSFLKNG